jgi:hypothetical protein
MHPAFPDIVGQSAAERIDDKARVWTITRGADGRLEERLDPSFLECVEDAECVDDIADAFLTAAALQDVADGRVW